eukprot:COSAG01_NODE_51134_length_357_cov_0.806202_1_plen_20_part_10
MVRAFFRPTVLIQIRCTQAE